MPMQNRATEPVTAFDLEGMKKQKPVRIAGQFENPFAIPGVWLRGNLHNHLDIKGKPEWLAEALEHYRRLGYDFIAGMDHDKVVPLEAPPGFAVVPGAEISSNGHLLALGVLKVPKFDTSLEGADRMVAAVRAVKASGGIAVLAHPFKTGYSWAELNRFCEAGLDGIEVVNSNVRGKGSDTGRADQLWHNLMREGWRLIALGNDDAHGPHEDISDNGWGGVSHVAWTGVLAREHTAQGVLDAVREGRTYASEGPELRGVECGPDGKLTVRCSPCVACHFRSVGGNWGGGSVFPPEGEAAAEAFAFDFATTGYRVQDDLVVVLQDQFGRRAWTSPMPVNITVEERD